MPISPAQIAALLESNKQGFRNMKTETAAHIERFAKRFRDVEKEIPIEALQETAEGAFPVEEGAYFNRELPGPVQESSISLDGEKGLKKWGRRILEGRAVAAVDGSQIYPSEESLFSFGVVNTAWFINHHTAGEGGYESRNDPRIVLSSAGEDFVDDAVVNFTRTLEEIRKTREIVERLSGTGTDETCRRNPVPLVFFDGSLILSFAEHITDHRKEALVSAVCELLQTSERCAVPVCGYIDISRAKDLVRMLSDFPASCPPGNDTDASRSQNPRRTIAGNFPHETKGEGSRSPPPRGIFDAAVLNRIMVQMSRTAAFVSCRKGILDEYGEFSRKVCFCYAKLNQGLPVRLEFPRWIADAGLTDELVGICAAQGMAGGEYPYALKRAHDMAVVREADRQRFMRMFASLARETGIGGTLSAKTMAKNRK